MVNSFEAENPFLDVLLPIHKSFAQRLRDGPQTISNAFRISWDIGHRVRKQGWGLVCFSDIIARISVYCSLLPICPCWKVCLSSSHNKSVNSFEANSLLCLFIFTAIILTTVIHSHKYACVEILFVLPLVIIWIIEKIHIIIKFNWPFGFKAFDTEIVLVAENRLTRLEISKQFQF